MFYSSNIRVDTLAQILTYSNVHAGCNMAVVDTCNGLVVSSILERLGGKLLYILKLYILVVQCKG